jgi:indolepyruvate ferredoxin oxidoreductase
MCIKDEIYVSHLLTSEEKMARDRERHNVDPGRGDRIRYRFHTRPEFDFGPFKLRLKISTRPWQLKLMSKQRWLRKLLPFWHRREKDFRDWYLSLVDEFAYSDEAEYERYCRALESTAEVNGYREVRYPKMRVARERARQILNQEIPVEQAPLMELPVTS